MTWPAGFTQIVNFVSGSQKLRAAWKRLTAGDTGNYTPTWTGSQWSLGHCILITGGLASGDPIEGTPNTASGTGTSIPSTSLTVATAAFLAHLCANENAGTATPPTSFTEVQDSNYLHTNYRIPGASGSYTASGGTLSASTLKLAALIAVKPDTGSGDITGTGAATAPTGTSAGAGATIVAGTGAASATPGAATGAGAAVASASVPRQPRPPASPARARSRLLA